MLYKCDSCKNKWNIPASDYAIACPWCGDLGHEVLLFPQTNKHRFRSHQRNIGSARPLLADARYVSINFDGSGGKIAKQAGAE